MARSLEKCLAVILLLAAFAPSGCSILGPEEGPQAEFRATSQSGTAPFEVQFTDQSKPGSSPITKWTWLFGDGDKSSERNPTHVYQEPGTYGVLLRVETDVDVNSKFKESFITVVPSSAPDADFSGTPRGGPKPLTVQFTDLSRPGSGPITSWSWAFGDGATSTAKNPSHTYQNDGTYNVSLTVQTWVGSNTETKSSYVVVSVAPTAAFTGTPLSGSAPLAVQFTDASTPGTSPITGWSWSFGDGATSSAQNPSHTYASGGSYAVSLTVTTADGSDSEDKPGYVTVANAVLPTAAFSGTPRSGIRPLTVQFTDLSTPGTSPITAWSWSFGDGGTSSAQNPSHTYATAGSYAVTLTVTTSAGSDSDTQAGYIIASDPVLPTAAFSGTPRSGIRPLTVQFTDLSTPGTSPITARAWSFGDGGTSTAQNPSHTYATAGSYAVTLTVTTLAGSDSDTQTGYVVVSDPVLPTAAFSGTPRSGAVPLTVQFTDQSTAGSFPITSWSWSFGDGGTSTAQNPSHAYASPGSYTVTLDVTTSAGSDGETRAGYIVATQPPTADFSGTPRTGDRPLTVQFSDLSTQGSAPITAWSWTFGDGGTSVLQNPSHSYAAAGTFAVALTVTTADGTDTRTRAGYITVSEPPVPPVAEFSGTPTTGSTPLTVQFSDLSTPGTASITSRLWSFGDGGTSTAQNPSHTYAAAGSYTVTLTVTTSVGSDGETKTDYVVATQPPAADFGGTPRTGDRPLTVQFSDLSTAGSAPITAWSWSFGDGGTSTVQNPSHVYATADTFTVALFVSTADGTDTETKADYITVSEPPAPPVAAFSGTPASGPAPLAVQFSDLSIPGTAPIASWSWSFGDGGTSTTQNPSHTYLLPGAYSVSLAVTTADGTDSTGMVDYITACQAPTADFSADTTDGVAPLTVQFTDLSAAGEGSITAWSWTFGDGGTSTAQNPSYSYATPGTYDVSLSVTDACGTRTATKAGFVTVQNPCNPAAYSIADAFVEVRADADQDGCAERARVHFDANVDAGCSKSVFGRVFFRIAGTTDWGTPLQSPCFTINGASAADETFVQVQNLALGFYEIRIELYECGGTTPVASRDYLDDTDLDNQCFE